MTSSTQFVHGDLAVTIATGFGPRLTGLQFRGGPNLFAELPEAHIRREGASAPFRFRGGHRLWAAPEVPSFTYAPDDLPVTIDVEPDTTTVAGPTDASGLRKGISLRPGPGTGITVRHKLTNTGETTVRVAPWAITQMPTGGEALMPLGTAEPDRFQASGSLVTWPYTRLDDPLIKVTDEWVSLAAKRTDETKVGTPLRRGWMAYRTGDLLFVKRATHDDAADHVDLEATGQCFCSSAFLELETIGALEKLPPGTSAHHDETWEVHPTDPDTPLHLACAGLDTGSPHESPEATP